jgi:cleavage stimulation factor subunit 2
MPPEQMFELMKQMKQTVISNPAQTRRLLMENPQLAYALLQVQLLLELIITYVFRLRLLCAS